MRAVGGAGPDRAVLRLVQLVVDDLEASTRSEPRSSTGDTRKWRWIRTGAPVGLRSAKPRRISRLRSRVRLGKPRAAHSALRCRGPPPGVDHHVHPRQLPQLLQLLVGERRLGGAAAAEDVDLPDAARRAPRGRARRCRSGEDVLLGWRGSGRGPSPRPCCPPPRRGLGLEVGVEVAEVGVGVVPAGRTRWRSGSPAGTRGGSPSGRSVRAPTA